MNPSAGTLERIERLTGSAPVSWTHRAGGYSIAGRWSLELADGRNVFAKLATTDDIARFLRDEHRNMAAIRADFVCEIVGFDDGERPLLLLEDLGHGRWPPPWEPGDLDRVSATLERMWAMTPPPHLPSAERYRPIFSCWKEIADDPIGFLSLGMCSADWLQTCLPVLRETEDAIVLEGDDLVHFDVRSDNLCFDGDRVVLVDWNWACRGDRGLDLLGLPSIRLEGGPVPEEAAPGLGPLATGFAGFLGANAWKPPPEGAPTVRTFQLRQLRICLPWACRELGLPEPDLPWASREIEDADEALATGSIGEDEWYARVEEPLADAYLAHAEPWRQSGKGGDETDWRWARELTLDVVHDGDAVLDVGCANGYLMESLHRWAGERGVRVEPYGIDISWRLAALARRRLPQWADRIFEGNVTTWTPPRRFDVVHTALDYMPATRRREHVERVLREFLVPGGRLVLRANRVPGSPDPVRELEEAGFTPAGVIEARHPRTGDVRRTAYLVAPVG